MLSGNILLQYALNTVLYLLEYSYFNCHLINIKTILQLKKCKLILLLLLFNRCEIIVVFQSVQNKTGS